MSPETTRKKLSPLVKGITIKNHSKQLYQLEDNCFTSLGKLFFPDNISIRRAIQLMNRKREIINFPERTVSAGELNGLIIITEVIQIIIHKYREELHPHIFKQIYSQLNEQFGEFKIYDLINEYREQFSYLNKNTDDYFLPDILVTWLANNNTAFDNYYDLFDDSEVSANTAYISVIENIIQIFDEQPLFGSEQLNLVRFLREPAIKYPASIFKQLEYIKQHWAAYLGDYLYVLQQALDLLKEEEKHFLGGPGPSYIHEFDLISNEPERFSLDKDWMSKLVLISKSIFVWMHQLSLKYQREIKQLNQIPEEELQLLAARGINGIWLIGIWERSFASMKSKHLHGNTDKIASAYSLQDYVIAVDLGGEQAMRELQENAWKYGLRIACDMVPNHMGIDSNLIVEHPDWFLQLPYSPFPAYTFNSQNLSKRPEIEVYLEDHYYDKTDAAVVFKYYDRRNSQTRYIYHGNDGTGIPWNDTAQLNYLLPEVREEVINKIIGIARQFPVIRFDAAMTLVKKHIQRLWFPEPGSGGDIPTRSEFGMSKKEFEQHMPVEFWREVVDRVIKEVPDTLLLAEAFWMMEGYFVRSLGMHRVYNSAFMNMLAHEENDKYRKLIFNVLEFNPDILKRYVNFMSNPDEATAIAQFGKDDKYFGVCILMCTMPGLPMFAHGQIEALTERYGMEYCAPVMDESEDEYFIARHEREIFPLLNKRYLFAEVENFLLFDFYTEAGHLNENVFAYSNKWGDECSLVVYNNKYEQASGWIHHANTVFKDKNNHLAWMKKNLGEAWQLHNDADYYVIMRDFISGAEYIRNSKEIWDRGIYQELGAFKYAVYWNVREVKDNEDKHYDKLCKYLQGGGVADIEVALKRMELFPVLDKFEVEIDVKLIKYLEELRQTRPEEFDQQFKAEMRLRLLSFIEELNDFVQGNNELGKVTDNILDDISEWMKLGKYLEEPTLLENKKYGLVLLFWILTHRLGELISEEEAAEISAAWLGEMLLGDEIRQKACSFLSEDNVKNIDLLIKLITRHQYIWQQLEELPNSDIVSVLISDNWLQKYIHVHEYEDIVWFEEQAFDEFIDSLFLANLLMIIRSGDDVERRIKKFNKFYTLLKEAKEFSEFHFQKFLETFKHSWLRGKNK